MTTRIGPVPAVGDHECEGCGQCIADGHEEVIVIMPNGEKKHYHVECEP